ncbi:MAG: pilus assembly protein TadG-related protein [Actinobacteria bacterium]|nr:pilus assembly protein TadG-related protein [Actinomycetota bacterium]MCA1721514.1 pilus assembly protein TadG-related protein [Actinomycetota bacterium]
MRRPQGDDGTIGILIVGFTAVLLLLVAVVVDVSAVVLARRGAASAADGAAIAAAQQLNTASLYANGLDGEIPLSPEKVADVVAQYAADAAQGQPGLALEPSVDEAGTTATVVATRRLTLPFTGWLTTKEVTVTAVARAKAPLVAP